MTARPKINFYLRSDNLNCMLGKLECSLVISFLAFKVFSQKKRMDWRAYNPVEQNCKESLTQGLTLPTRQDRFNQENSLKNAPVRSTISEMNTKSNSVDCLLKMHSVYNNFTSDKLK